jgi:hypothetical protein
LTGGVVFVINTFPPFGGLFFGQYFGSRKSRAAKIFEKKVLTGLAGFAIVPILLQRLGRKQLVFEN